MKYRRLGRTGLEVSAVGIGTNQLRTLSHRDAIATLVAAFESGVNIVHTSADYEGAQELVAEAMASVGLGLDQISCAVNAYDVHGSPTGSADAFAAHFERTCEIFDSERLPLYGVAAVEDREALGENLWGAGGMVEFLEARKADGRLGGSFFTSHGDPSFIRGVLEQDRFDAAMVSATPLGFHLLSLEPPGVRTFENPARNRLEVFEACAQRDVGVMVMMPLAGGLLTKDRVSQPAIDAPPVDAALVLRKILADPEVSCVMPGATSPAEAGENARAGDGPFHLDADERALLERRVSEMRATICSRCGACEPLCSKGLPVSWLFRAGEMAEYPDEAFETWPEVEYFTLHPSLRSACADCEDRSCECPYGLDVPSSLIGLHDRMIGHLEAARVPPPPGDTRADRGIDGLGARLLRLDPPTDGNEQTGTVRVFLQNQGSVRWGPDDSMEVRVLDAAGRDLGSARPRWQTHPGGRAHVAIEVPSGTGTTDPIVLQLADSDAVVELFRGRFRDITSMHRAESAPIEGDTVVTSHAPSTDYAVEWIHDNLPERWPEGTLFQGYARVANAGNRVWHRHPDPDRGAGAVQLVVKLDGETVSMEHLPHDVAPGQEAVLAFRIEFPEALDHWQVELTFVEQGVAWFAERGAASKRRGVDRMGADSVPNGAALRTMRRHNPAFYIPSEGIPIGANERPYPLVLHEASGARVRDRAGNEWVDYAMGWGSALLGHANPAVVDAVAASLGSGGVVSLPHELEAETTDDLLRLFPAADTVLFGKNGSDVTSAAARVARLATGRRTILSSGFHGWQEPFASVFEPALAGPHTAEVHRFALNDLDALAGLLKTHGAETAAVMLEVAAQVEGVDGPVRDVDPAFLADAAEMARAAGALVIFDEILTGFRYRKGFVQRATGVTPDLTCLGKGLGAGFPIAALVGHAAVLGPTLGRAFYHPTFKSEVHSFAAARAALGVYRSTDVPRAVAVHGRALRDGVAGICDELGVDGRLIGPPFRMVFRYTDRSDPHRTTLRRTLLHQELLERGLMTFRGFMLPSLAHGDAELDRALVAFRGALASVQAADADDRFVSALRLPLLV